MKKLSFKKVTVFAICLFSVLLLSGCGKSVALQDYLVTKCTGYEGYGTLKVGIDEKALTEFIMENGKIDLEADKDAQDVAALFGKETAVQYVAEDCADIDVEVAGDAENGSLVNGDKYQFTTQVDTEEFKKRTGITVKNLDTAYTVEGLQPIEKKDLFASVNIIFSGYNGYGVMEYAFDDPSIENDLVIEKAEDKNLRNGQKISVSMTPSDLVKFADKYGWLPQEFNKEIEVSGLKELTQVDPFENITVSFSGESGSGEADLEKKGGFTDELIFTFDKQHGLSNGDEVVVTCEPRSEDSFTQEYGMVLSKKEQSYTVSGLLELLRSAEQFTPEVLEEMDKNARLELENYFKNNGCTIKSMDYLGEIYGMPRESVNRNYIYLVYRYDVEQEKNGFMSKAIYRAEFPGFIYCRFSDTKRINDECVPELKSKELPSHSQSVDLPGVENITAWDIDSMYGGAKGYASLDELIADVESGDRERLVYTEKLVQQ